MKILARVLSATTALLASGVALAHPGHEAPPVHAHDLDEALAMAAAILGVVIVGFGVAAAKRARAKDKGRSRGSGL